MNKYYIHFTILDPVNGNYGSWFHVPGKFEIIEADTMEEAWNEAKRMFREYPERDKVIEVTMSYNGVVCIRKWSNDQATRNHFLKIKYPEYQDPAYEIGEDSVMYEGDFEYARNKIKKAKATNYIYA